MQKEARVGPFLEFFTLEKTIINEKESEDGQSMQRKKLNEHAGSFNYGRKIKPVVT